MNSDLSDDLRTERLGFGLFDDYLSDEQFKNIYSFIKGDLKEDVTELDVRNSLGMMLAINIRLVKGYKERERALTYAQISVLVNRLYHNVNNLLKTIQKIHSAYGSGFAPYARVNDKGELCYIVDHSEVEFYSLVPEWLNKYIDGYDLEVLHKNSTELGLLNEVVKKPLVEGKKPRLDIFQIYLLCLANLWADFTGLKPKVQRQYYTKFADFVVSFFDNVGVPSKKKNILEVSAKTIYEEFQKIKNDIKQ